MMITAEHEGDLIEYPDGRTARIDAQGNILGDTVPAPAPDLFDGLEVLSDPFPATFRSFESLRLKIEDVNFDGFTTIDFGEDEDVSDVVETARTSKPIMQLLKSLPEDSTALQIAKRFDATTLNSAEETHAASDALIAIIRLRKMCADMIEASTPINAEECLAFIEQAKHRLNVVALACPFLKGGR